MKIPAAVMLLSLPLFLSGCDSADEPTATQIMRSVSQRFAVDAEWLHLKSSKHAPNYMSVIDVIKTERCTSVKDISDKFHCPVIVRFLRSQGGRQVAEYTGALVLSMKNEQGSWYCDAGVVAELQSVAQMTGKRTG